MRACSIAWFNPWRAPLLVLFCSFPPPPPPPPPFPGSTAAQPSPGLDQETSVEEGEGDNEIDLVGPPEDIHLLIQEDNLEKMYLSALAAYSKVWQLGVESGRGTVGIIFFIPTAVGFVRWEGPLGVLDEALLFPG